jgi:hypothetical protein
MTSILRSAEALTEGACAETGLDDFGHDTL